MTTTTKNNSIRLRFRHGLDSCSECTTERQVLLTSLKGVKGADSERHYHERDQDAVGTEVDEATGRISCSSCGKELGTETGVIIPGELSDFYRSMKSSAFRAASRVEYRGFICDVYRVEPGVPSLGFAPEALHSSGFKEREGWDWNRHGVYMAHRHTMGVRCNFDWSPVKEPKPIKSVDLDEAAVKVLPTVMQTSIAKLKYHGFTPIQMTKSEYGPASIRFRMLLNAGTEQQLWVRAELSFHIHG